MNINELSPGDKGTILDFEDDYLAIVLNDLGLFVGEEIELASRAPLGDPICIKTEDTLVSIRVADAELIIVNKAVQ